MVASKCLWLIIGTTDPVGQTPSKKAVRLHDSTYFTLTAGQVVFDCDEYHVIPTGGLRNGCWRDELRGLALLRPVFQDDQRTSVCHVEAYTQCMFQGTRYASRIASIPPRELRELHEHFSLHPQSWQHWSTEIVLSVYMDPYCHQVHLTAKYNRSSPSTLLADVQCHDFGCFFLRCSVPPLKLCAQCRKLAQYKFIYLEEGLWYYGLTQNDTFFLPTLKSIAFFRVLANSI